MLDVEVPFKLLIVINHPPNGWTESWHLYARNLPDCLVVAALLVEARSFLLAAGCHIEWAAVQQEVEPFIQWPAIGAQITGLPQWGNVHHDSVSLLWRFDTGLGKIVPRHFRAVADEEVNGKEWTSGPLDIPPGPAGRPAVPAAATKAELYQYTMAMFRDLTCHVAELPVNVAGQVLHRLTPWADVFFNRVSSFEVGSEFHRISWEALDWNESPGFSPCGTVIGAERACYAQECYFFSSGPAQQILYYLADPAAAVCPLPTIFWGIRLAKQCPDGMIAGEQKTAGTYLYSLGLSWGSAPGIVPGATAAQMMGLTVCPWGNDPETPDIYKELCDMPVPIPITVDDLPGAVEVLNVTHMSFPESDYILTEVAPGWAKPSIKWQAGMRDFNAWRQMGCGKLERIYFAGIATNTEILDFQPQPNSLYALPLVVPAGGTIDRLLCEVVEAGAPGAKARIALYRATSQTDLWPDELILESDDIDTTVTGLKTVPCNIPLQIGTLYWLTLCHNSGGTAAKFAGQSSIDFFPIWGCPVDSLNTSAGYGHRCEHIFAPNPDPFPLPDGAIFLLGSDQEPSPKLGVHFSGPWLSDPPASPCMHLAFVLEITAVVTEFSPGFAAMSPAIELELEILATIATVTPPSASMAPDVELTLEISATVSTVTPSIASMSPVIEFTLEPSAATSILSSQTRPAGAGSSLAGGGNAWSNPGNITASDDAYAVVHLEDPTFNSQQLHATNFGFTLPAGSTVVGVIVDIELSQTVLDQIIESDAILIGTGVGGLDDHAGAAALPTSDTVWQYGGAADDWTETLTETEVNDASFGFGFRVILANVLYVGDANVDYVEMTVWYEA